MSGNPKRKAVNPEIEDLMVFYIKDLLIYQSVNLLYSFQDPYWGETISMSGKRTKI